MPEPLIYTGSNEYSEDDSLNPRSGFPSYSAAPYRTKGPQQPHLVRLPSTDSSTSSLPDPATFPLPQEYRFGGGSQVGSSAASISSAGGGWKNRSSVRDSGASFGDHSLGAVERRSAYGEAHLDEEQEENVEDVPSPVHSDSVQFNRYSAQPTWSRTHRLRPSISESLQSSPASSSNSRNAVGLGISAMNGQPATAHSPAAHPNRESMASQAANGPRWSHACSQSVSSTGGAVAPYDSEDDRSDDGTSETSQYDWESEPHREMAEGAAIVLVEDGRGKVINGSTIDMTRMSRLAGDVAGGTHLLLSSTSTPELVPDFLRAVLPNLTESLVVLDISSCGLSFFPPDILTLLNLEELDVSNNPLRTLPPALGSLHSLRVLAANSIGCTGLPAELGQLPCLHTLSLRDNRFFSVPRWLCLLPNLETLYVEGNPFQGFWKDFVQWRLLQWSPLKTEALNASQETANSTSRDSFFSASSHPYAQVESPFLPPTSRPSSKVYAPELQRSTSSASSSDYRTLQPARYGQRPSLPTTFSSPWVDSSTSQIHRSPGRARANTTYQTQPTRLSPPPPPTSIVPIDGPALPSTIGRAPVRRLKSAGALFQAANKQSSRPGTADSEASSPDPTTATEQPQRSMQKRFASLSKEKGWSAPNNLRKVSDGGDVEMLQEEDPTNSRHGRQSSTGDKDKGKLRTMFKKMSMGRMRSGSGTGSALRPPPPVHSNTSPNFSSLASLSVPSSRRPSTTIGYGASNLLDSRASSPVGFQVLAGAHVPPSSGMLTASGRTALKAKRRSYLHFDGTPSLNAISIPSTSPFMGSAFLNNDRFPSPPMETPVEDNESILESYHAPSPGGSPVIPEEGETQDKGPSPAEMLRRRMYAEGLGQIMAYLQDLHDLSLSPVHPSSLATPTPDSNSTGDTSQFSPSAVSATLVNSSSTHMSSTLGSGPSMSTISSTGRRTTRIGSGVDVRGVSMVASEESEEYPRSDEKKYRSDSKKRAKVIQEIVLTEQSYVNGLRDLVDLYIRPSEAAAPGTKDTVIPAAERKIVYNGITGLLQFHEDSFLPSLRQAAAPILQGGKIVVEDEEVTLAAALKVADVFRCYNPFMRMYSTYINGFDNALARLRTWTEPSSGSNFASSPNVSSVNIATMGLSLGAMGSPANSPDSGSPGVAPLSYAQRKRVKQFLKGARKRPAHTQINLEAYLLLPVQRIPRYKMLLDDLCRCTPPRAEDDNYILEDVALDIAALASSMNEEKRESESRQRLVQWQSRIIGKFPSPLVQPHRKLLLDGTLILQKFIKRSTTFVEVAESVFEDGDNTITPSKSVVPIEALESSDPQSQPIVVVLTSDLMILCQLGPSQDAEGPVELYAVLRLQTKDQPASILSGTSRTIRVVDDKAILYLEAPSTSAALTWVKALNVSFQQAR